MDGWFQDKLPCLTHAKPSTTAHCKTRHIHYTKSLQYVASHRCVHSDCAMHVEWLSLLSPFDWFLRWPFLREGHHLFPYPSVSVFIPAYSYTHFIILSLSTPLSFLLLWYPNIPTAFHLQKLFPFLIFCYFPCILLLPLSVLSYSTATLLSLLSKLHGTEWHQISFVIKVFLSLWMDARLDGC